MVTNYLLDLFNSINHQMADDYERIKLHGHSDPGTAGDQGEEDWAKLLRNWLPPIFQIVTKGRILSHDGNASPQVDILVLRPEYPQYLINNKLYLAGGVLAAFECKTTLKASHFQKFFKNSKVLKNIVEPLRGTPYRELQSPLIYGLLAHSYEWKKLKSDPISYFKTKIISTDKAQITHPFQMPDLICVADLGCFVACKTNLLGIDNDSLDIDNEIWAGYLGYSIHINDQIENFSPLGTFMASLLKKLSWQYINLRYLSDYFSKTKIHGAGNGTFRKWDINILSNNLVENGKYKPKKDHEDLKWDEWVVDIS